MGTASGQNRCISKSKVLSSTHLTHSLNLHHRHLSLPPTATTVRGHSSSCSTKETLGYTRTIRGGSTRVSKASSPMEGISKQEEGKQLQLDDDENQSAILRYRMEQQHLLQLRSTFLSEALSSRGIKVGPNLLDVSTTDAERPPQIVDWECSLSTRDNPKVRGDIFLSILSLFIISLLKNIYV